MKSKKDKALNAGRKGIIELSEKEQSLIKGGGWEYFDGVGYTYMLDEVSVYGTNGGCSFCNQWDNLNTGQGRPRVTTHLGEWFAKRWANHDVGCPWCR